MPPCAALSKHDEYWTSTSENRRKSSCGFMKCSFQNVYGCEYHSTARSAAVMSKRESGVPGWPGIQLL